MNVEYKIIKVPIKEIVLDKTNPRIAKFLEYYKGEIKAEQIAMALGVGDDQTEQNATTFQSLKASIRTNGGVINPIIINKDSDGKMIVIEGNTRAAIYKEFKADSVPGNWDDIPATVYENMSPEKIDSIRLQAHLVGPRPWDPYSKAKYLDLLRNSEHLTLNQIVNYCGGREKEINDYIQAYNYMEKYYRKVLGSDDEFDPKRFSAFVELARSSKLQEAIINHGFTFEDFARWIKDFKIYPLVTVRSLRTVLNNKKAREVFIEEKGKGAIKTALKVLEEPTSDAVLKDASLLQLCVALKNKLNDLRFNEVAQLKADPESLETQSLFDMKEQLVSTCDYIDPES